MPGQRSALQPTCARPAEDAQQLLRWGDVPAVVNQEPSASALSSQRRFRAYASPMHVGVQFSPSEKAGLEDQQEAYPDICFALDGAEALCSTVRPLSAGRLGCC